MRLDGAVLEGLLEHERATGASDEVTAARLRGQEYLLERRGRAVPMDHPARPSSPPLGGQRGTRRPIDGRERRGGMTAPALTIVPVNEASCEALQAVFGTRGEAATCQCQRYELRPRESFGSFPAEERGFRLRQQTDCGNPGSSRTSVP